MRITTKDIGRKVWLYTKKDWNFVLHQDKTYTIKETDDSNDYDKRVVVVDEDGVEVETTSTMVLFVPNYELDQDAMLYEYLDKNDCYPSEIYTNSEGVVSVLIEWGDWKHEHLWCNDLMAYIGFDTCCEEYVTEENGSDCYSAEHYFVKR